MHVMGSLVSVDGFQIHHVPHHVVLIRDTVSTVHVARSSCNIKRFPAVVPFEQRYRLG